MDEQWELYKTMRNIRLLKSIHFDQESRSKLLDLQPYGKRNLKE